MRGDKESGMRILSVTAQKPCSTGSGVYLTEVVKALAKEGHTQNVLAGIARGEQMDMPDGVKTYPVYFESEGLPYPVVGMSDEMPYISTKYKDMTEEMTVQFRNAFLAVLDEVIEREDPELILCHHLYYLTALVRGRYPEKKVYGFCHNTDLRQMKNTSFQREFIRSQIPRLDRIFVLQEAQKEKIRQIYPVKNESMTVIGTGYNSHVFRITGEKPGKKDDVVRLVFAGKITQKKGVKSLLRAMNLLDEESGQIKLVLAGGAGNQKEYEEIKELAAHCRYPVRFAGCVPQMELAKLYNDGDIFVLPSMYEGLPLTVIESLACGDRVVMTRLDGVTDWLEDMLPDADIRYVDLPKMKGADEAVEEELPAFEKRLAQALEDAIWAVKQENRGLVKNRVCDVSGISWQKIAQEVIR